MSGIHKPSWVATDSDDNATSTATRAAPLAGSGISHFITSVSGGYSAAAAGKTLILKAGTTEIARWYVHNSLSLSFSSAIQLPPATSANLELQASGTPGTLGAATMTGYTL